MSGAVMDDISLPAEERTPASNCELPLGSSAVATECIPFQEDSKLFYWIQIRLSQVFNEIYSPKDPVFLH